MAAELPHISEAKGMRMEGGTRLAFLSFYGVQNARTLVVHAAEPTSQRVAARARRGVSRAAVAAAGWTRGPQRPGEAAGPLARWLGPRGSSVACKRRLSRSQWAETLGWLVSKLRLVGDKDSLVVCVEPVQAVPPTPVVTSEPEMVEEEDDGDLADLGLDAFAEAYYGRLREAAGAPGSPSVASVVPVSLPPSPAEEESYPLSPPEVISDVYGGAREAALNAIDFEEVRLRTRRPQPNRGRTRASGSARRRTRRSAHQRGASG